MTATELNDLWSEMFTQLWPKQAATMTDEERSAYFRVMRPATRNQAERVLRGLKETSRFYPGPADVRKALKIGQDVGVANRDTISQPELDRRQWTKLCPVLEDEIRGFDDREIRLIRACWEYQMAVWTYGLHGRGAIGMYWRWQSLLDGDCPHHGCTEAGAAAYRELFPVDAGGADRGHMPKLDMVIVDYIRSTKEAA